MNAWQFDLGSGNYAHFDAQTNITLHEARKTAHQTQKTPDHQRNSTTQVKNPTYIASNPYIMKTSVSLTILGAYNVLMGVMCLLMPGDMAVAAIGEANATNPELLEIAATYSTTASATPSPCGLLFALAIRKARWTPPKTPCSPTALARPCFSLFASVFANTPV